MNTITLSDHELFGVLLNALSTTAERYADNAKELRAAAPLAAEAERAGKHPFITERGAIQLAEQFEHQATEALALIDKLQEESEDAD